MSRYVEGVDPDLTVKHLLTMQAGIDWNEDGPYEQAGNDWAAMERSSDWLDFVLTKPRTSKPGERFNYNSGVPMILAEVLRKATGEPVEDYARQHLFTPLGIDSFYWKKSPTGLPDAQGGLYLKSTDLARFGALYARGGDNLFPTGWVEDSVRPGPTADAGNWKFGYQWWLLPGDNGYVMTALGYGGQRLFVLPKHELVVVMNGWNLFGASSLSTNDFLERILAAVGASETGILTRSDGTTITYYLDRPRRDSFPLAVILQGSECLRVSHKYSALIEQLLAAGVGVLRVEKPGLDASVEIGTCPPQYRQLNTPQRRVLDLTMVTSELRRKEPRWNGKMALAGGSEGAMIAAMTAPLIPETRAVLLLSGGGGLTFAEEVLESVRMQMTGAGATEKEVEQRLSQMRQQMELIRQQPDPNREWMSDGGLVCNTHLWWARALPLRLATSLARVEAPILIVHGRADTSTPLASAEKLKETLEGKLGLEYRTYDGGHSPPLEVLQSALTWLVERLSATDLTSCSGARSDWS